MLSRMEPLFSDKKCRRITRTEAGEWIKVGNNRRCLLTRMKWPVCEHKLKTYVYYLYRTPIVFAAALGEEKLYAAFDYPLSMTKLSVETSHAAATLPGPLTLSHGRIHLGRYDEFVLAVLPTLSERDFADPRDVDLGTTTVVRWTENSTHAAKIELIAPGGGRYRVVFRDGRVIGAIDKASSNVVADAAPIVRMIPDALPRRRDAGIHVGRTLGPKVARVFELLKHRNIDDLFESAAYAYPVSRVARDTGVAPHLVRLWATTKGLTNFVEAAKHNAGIAALVGATHLRGLDTGVRHPLRQVCRTFDAACWLNEAYPPSEVGQPLIIGEKV